MSSFSGVASRTEHPREEDVLKRRRTCRRSVALLRGQSIPGKRRF